MKVTLSLTHNCNLSCRYCYSGRKFEKEMSFVTAQKIVDFAMNITPINQKIEFSFFGGEPLLCFDLIKQIIDYIRGKERELGRRPMKYFLLSLFLIFLRKKISIFV